jgi:uncharacterized protein (DUF362 family)
VAALVELCKTAGAKRVVVAEAVSYGTRRGRKRTTEECFKLLGVQTAVEAAGGEILCLEDDERITVDVPEAFCLHRLDYPKSLLDADVLVNMPCMKTHAMTMVTLGVKNFQGILTDEHKYEAHRDDISQHVVDIYRVRLPDLTVIDALLAMEGNGAGEAGIPVSMNTLLAGPDMVAVNLHPTLGPLGDRSLSQHRHLYLRRVLHVLDAGRGAELAACPMRPKPFHSDRWR